MTFADAARLDPDREAGELDDGEWKPVTRNTWRHGQIVAKLTFLLQLWARDRPAWLVATGDPGTKLSRDPDVLRDPDIGVIRADRMPAGRGADGWLDGAPDLAIEVFGDAQPAAALMEKPPSTSRPVRGSSGSSIPTPSASSS